MKTLTLIRHAKSDWSNIWLKDFDRPLAKRWDKQIKYIWKILKKINFKTQLVVCSSAKRAELTFEWLNKKIGKFYKEIEFTEEIYNYHISDISKTIKLIKNFDNKYNNITIFWHNSSFENLLNYFINSSWMNIRTLWVIKINFDIDNWENIENNWKLIYYISPEV